MNLIFPETDFQIIFLIIFNLGYPDILKIKLVLNLKIFKIVNGNDVLNVKI